MISIDIWRKSSQNEVFSPSKLDCLTNNCIQENESDKDDVHEMWCKFKAKIEKRIEKFIRLLNCLVKIVKWYRPLTEEIRKKNWIKN